MRRGEDFVGEVHGVAVKTLLAVASPARRTCATKTMQFEGAERAQQRKSRAIHVRSFWSVGMW